MKKTTLFLITFNLVFILSLVSQAREIVDSNLSLPEQHRAWNELAQQIDTATLYPKVKQAPMAVFVKDLIDPKEAFNATVMMIDSAQYSVDLMTYIFRPDDVGTAVLESLRKAVERGVCVRMAIDSLGSFDLNDIRHSALKALLTQKPGFIKDPKTGLLTSERAFVEVRIFNSISNVGYQSRMLSQGAYHIVTRGRYSTQATNDELRWINRRVHSKMLIVDKKFVKIGGRNKDGDYYGEPESNEEVVHRTYNDAEVLVKDAFQFPSELRIQDTVVFDFNSLYYHEGNKVLTPNWFLADDVTYLTKMKSALSNLHAKGTKLAEVYEKMKTDNFLETGFHLSQGRFVSEIANITRQSVVFRRHAKPLHQNPNTVVDAFEDVIRNAKNDIYIVSPYLKLTPKEFNILMARMEENPRLKLHVLTNSLVTTDNLPAQGEVALELTKGLMENDRAQKLKSQIEFLELGKIDSAKLGGIKSYGKLHAKFFAADIPMDENVTINAMDGVPTLFDGSHNLDSRSRLLNAEVGIVMTPPDATMLQRANELGIEVEKGGLVPFQKFIEYYNSLKKMSYEVYSDEWNEMMAHKKLRRKDQLSRRIFRCLTLLNLDKYI